jgi:hypothetical protein
MTKTLVNKIPFDGPRSHKEIIDKLRTEVKKVSRERLVFIISSFFTVNGIFRFVKERKLISVSYFGRILPSPKKYLKTKVYIIRRRKKRAAIAYLDNIHKLTVGRMIRRLIFLYDKWNIKRKEKGLRETDFKTFMYSTRHKMPKKKKIMPEDIEAIMYKFDDNGKIIIRKNSIQNLYHVIEEKKKKKLEKQNQIQH